MKTVNFLGVIFLVLWSKTSAADEKSRAITPLRILEGMESSNSVFRYWGDIRYKPKPDSIEKAVKFVKIVLVCRSEDVASTFSDEMGEFTFDTPLLKECKDGVFEVRDSIYAGSIKINLEKRSERVIFARKVASDIKLAP